MEAPADVCRRFNVPFFACPPQLKVGIALNVRQGLLPLNGMRRVPDTGTSGWFIWAGEVLSAHPDFFVPLHAGHLEDWCPEVVKYLGLPPGWRFLIAPGYEDVWEDSGLLTDR